MECLEQSDVEGLSAHLEEFIFSELRFASAELEKLGIGNVTRWRVILIYLSDDGPEG